jgi:predicted hydrocarbon binding protein
MHGIIFASLGDYGRARLGAAPTDEIFGGQFFSMSEAHPDDEFAALADRTAARLGLSADELLLDFGAFTAEQTFASLYPAFFTIAGDTRTFLLTVEDRIHELVRATVPNATPPALRVHALDGERVEILYSSPRRLCRLLEGLVIGTGRYYDETIAVTELECMKEGAVACRFRVGST